MDEHHCKRDLLRMWSIPCGSNDAAICNDLRCGNVCDRGCDSPDHLINGGLRDGVYGKRTA